MMSSTGTQRHWTQAHITAIGDLYNQFPGYSILITADHGMSDKTNLVDPGKILQEHGIESRPVPLIKDRYVVHHSNLGGGFFIYISENNLHKAVKILNQVINCLHT